MHMCVYVCVFGAIFALNTSANTQMTHKRIRLMAIAYICCVLLSLCCCCCFCHLPFAIVYKEPSKLHENWQFLSHMPMILLLRAVVVVAVVAAAAATAISFAPTVAASVRTVR